MTSGIRGNLPFPGTYLKKAAKIPINLVSSMKSAAFRSQIVFWTRFPRRAKIAGIHKIHTNSEAEFLSVSAPRERRNDP
ncbi:MAG: hypothetical protein V8R21_09255 [Dysosmobacter sp.]